MASISGNGAKGHHKFTLEVTESYVSGGADNYSNFDFKFKISPIQTSWNWADWGSTISYTININGNKYTGTIPAYDGYSTVTLKTVTGIKIPHNEDGSKAITFSFGVTDGANQRYTCGNASGSGSMTLSKIPRYGTSNQSLKSKTETTITMNWSSDNTVDYLWYSKDNGSNWTGVDVTDATSGTYTISGLSANTTYNIKTSIRRKDSQLATESTTLSITTYDYPYCTESPNFTIGDELTLKFYNPLSRSIQITIIGADGTTYGGDTITGTSLSGYKANNWLNWWYSTIPTAQSGKYQVKVVYGSITKTRNNGNTYKIKGTETPSFSNFTYKDTNTSVTGVTGNDQVLVKGLSNLQVTISSANKMVANNGANPSKYIAIIDTLNKNVNYNTSDINLAVGTVTNSGTKRLTVTAYDSRTLSKAVYKDITVYDYAKPVINASIIRLNNFEAETTIKVSGTYTRLTIGGTDKNTVTSVKYRYREAGGSWGSWTNLSTSVTSGKFTCTDVVLSLDNKKSFEFEIQAVDKLQTNTGKTTVDVGQAIFFISTNNKACYINGELVKGSIVASVEEPTLGEEIWIQNSKNKFNANKYNFKNDYNSGVGSISTNEVVIKSYGSWARTKATLTGLKPNTPYVMSANVDKSQLSADTISGFYSDDFYQTSGFVYPGYITGKSIYKFISNESGLHVIDFYTNWSGDSVTGDVKYSNIQLEEGDVTTEYEPYTEKKIYTKNGAGTYDEFFNIENSINKQNYFATGPNKTVDITFTLGNVAIVTTTYKSGEWKPMVLLVCALSNSLLVSVLGEKTDLFSYSTHGLTLSTKNNYDGHNYTSVMIINT